MNAAQSILSDEMLHRFVERRAGYDRDNRFFHEDFDDLKRAGYLTMAVPRELGVSERPDRHRLPLQTVDLRGECAANRWRSHG